MRAGITHGPNMTHGFVTGNHIADKAASAKVTRPAPVASRVSSCVEELSEVL
ncbi:MAG: hypothetical protein ABI564_15935 [Ideonella sp.]